jgi:hypothetical protein
MKKCYLIYPVALKNFYIAKALEKKGYKIIGLNIYNEEMSLIRSNKKLRTYFIKKSMTNKEIEDFCRTETVVLYGEMNRKKTRYLENLEAQDIKNFKIDNEDRIFSFEERFIFEAAILDNKFMSPRTAFICSCKHLIYRKLGKPFFKITDINDFNHVPEDKYIIKPSLFSIGKRNVFVMENKKDYKKILESDPDIFSLNRIFILERYIEHISEIWAMTLFDSNGKPYILWFSTEKNHATFSVFEKDIYDEIKIINDKLKIKNWMAYIQFLIDKDGKLHFVDLNPRLPGDDDWHELLYRYLSGKSFAKTIVDLIIDHKPPTIIKSNKYIQEEEYNPLEPLKKNQKLWEYTDSYKQKPLLTFKKLDF